VLYVLLFGHTAHMDNNMDAEKILIVLPPEKTTRKFSLSHGSRLYKIT